MIKKIDGFISVSCNHCLHRDECELQNKIKETADEIFKLEIEEEFYIKLKCRHFVFDENTIEKKWVNKE